MGFYYQFKKLNKIFIKLFFFFFTFSYNYVKWVSINKKKKKKKKKLGEIDQPLSVSPQKNNEPLQC